MAGLIKREDIDAVRERANIEDIVGEHVTLKSGGVGSMKGLCPFHDERTPSFHVRPQVGLWHCFGCGEGGDVISFIQKINHTTFAEAVEYLAGKVGIELRYEEGGKINRGIEPGTRQRLLDANRLAETFYQEQLATPAAQVGREFLTGRGFDRRAAEYFGVGYAPAGWDNLTRHLRHNGYTEAELVAAGLCAQGNRGVYDRFRDRLVWPIRDVTGATVGFGARKISADDDGPKYLNTPETAIYKKSQVLYGLDLAKKDIARQHKIVVVEGYTDVMAAHLSGETTAVATCGTAFGEGHVRIVRRLLGDSADPAAGVLLSQGKQARGGEVIFTFDGDAAGQKAALRAFAEDQHFAAQTFVAVDPGGQDPCDLRMARGQAAIPELINSRKPLFEFVIRAALANRDLTTAEGRVAGLREAAPIVAGIRDHALRREYARSLAGWLGIREDEVIGAVKSAERAGGSAYRSEGTRGRNYGGANNGGHQRGNSWRDPREMSGAPGDPQGTPLYGVPQVQPSSPVLGSYPNDPTVKLERQALEVIVQMPQDALGAKTDDLPIDTFTVPVHRAAFEAVLAAGGVSAFGQAVEELRAQGVTGEHLLPRASTRWLEAVRTGVIPAVDSLLTELAVAPLPVAEKSAESVGAYAREVLLSIVQLSLTRQLAQLRNQQRQMDPSDEGYRPLLKQIIEVENRRRQLRESR